MVQQPKHDADRACSLLREMLLETRDLPRRVLRALGRAPAAAALLSPLGVLEARSEVKPVTYFTYGGAWKKAIMAAFVPTGCPNPTGGMKFLDPSDAMRTCHGPGLK
jgi:hypothetical protein